MDFTVDSVMNVSFDLIKSPIQVLYQSDYLTIRSYDPELEMLTLDYPNREVERGFLNYLMMVYIPQTADNPAFFIAEFYRDLREGRVEAFMTQLKSFFADFPYDSFHMIKLEQHYQDITFIEFKLLGFLTNNKI